ncbi:MAG TPA: hypothetical protein VND98_02550 [Solirubrobacterales bacterium]|nr:hypothetical protein [Solirubrobacterales bacterium]
MKRLKAPELKFPPALQDLFYDLRDRRLLPLLALVGVAIVAVPFLLSRSGPASPSPVLPLRAPVAVAATGGSRLKVVQSNPGLRQPRKRLGYLRVKDPFAEKFALLAEKMATAHTAQTKTATSKTATGATGATATTKTEGGGGSATHAPSGSSPTVPPSTGPTTRKLTIFTFAIDVKISQSEGQGKAKKQSETTRHRVEPPATLPNKATQVVTYIGVNPKTKNPLFLVSAKVEGVYGEGQCISGTGSCALLELEPNFAETLVYPDGVRYKIDVLKVEPVVAGHS